jgi:hypothetical protein
MEINARARSSLTGIQQVENGPTVVQSVPPFALISGE